MFPAHTKCIEQYPAALAHTASGAEQCPAALGHTRAQLRLRECAEHCASIIFARGKQTIHLIYSLFPEKSNCPSSGRNRKTGTISCG